MRRFTFYRTLLIVILACCLSFQLIFKIESHAQSEACPGAPATRLAVGMRASVTPANSGASPIPVRVREQAGTKAAIVTILQSGEAFLIIEGPLCVERYLWWKVRTDGGLIGWAAEGTSAQYFIDPLNDGKTSTSTSAFGATLNTPSFCPDAPKTQFVIGERGTVRPADKKAAVPNSARLREKPGTTARITGTLPEGVTFEIVGGPQCVESFIWWQIKAENGMAGWTAEGDMQRYYIINVKPTVTPTRYVFSVPIVEQVDCPGAALPTRFKAYMQGRVIVSLGVRQTLMRDGKRELNIERDPKTGNVIFNGVIPENGIFLVYMITCENQNLVLDVCYYGQTDPAVKVNPDTSLRFCGDIIEATYGTYNVEPIESYITATPYYKTPTRTPAPDFSPTAS